MRLLRRLRRQIALYCGGRWRARFVRCHMCAGEWERRQSMPGRYERCLAPARSRPAGFSEYLSCGHFRVCAGRWFGR